MFLNLSLSLSLYLSLSISLSLSHSHSHSHYFFLNLSDSHPISYLSIFIFSIVYTWDLVARGIVYLFKLYYSMIKPIFFHYTQTSLDFSFHLLVKINCCYQNWLAYTPDLSLRCTALWTWVSFTF